APISPRARGDAERRRVPAAARASLPVHGGAGDGGEEVGPVKQRGRTWLLDSRLAGVLLIVVLLALWQYSAVYVVKKPTWPPVSLVWQWLERLLDGTLLGHLW